LNYMSFGVETAEVMRLGGNGGLSLGSGYVATDPGAGSIIMEGNMGIGVTNPSQKLHVSGNMRLTGAFYDVNNSVGTSGQLLSSTVSGVDWIDASGVGTDDQTLLEVYQEAGNDVLMTSTYGDIKRLI